MIHALTPAPTTSASGVAEGARVACPSCGAVRSPREQWTFTGRETHWGYVYLVWTRDDGERYARFIK